MLEQSPSLSDKNCAFQRGWRTARATWTYPAKRLIPIGSIKCGAESGRGGGDLRAHQSPARPRLVGHLVFRISESRTCDPGPQSSHQIWKRASTSPSLCTQSAERNLRVSSDNHIFIRAREPPSCRQLQPPPPPPPQITTAAKTSIMEVVTCSLCREQFRDAQALSSVSCPSFMDFDA